MAKKILSVITVLCLLSQPPIAWAELELRAGVPDNITVGKLKFYDRNINAPHSPSNEATATVAFGGKSWKVVGYKPKGRVYNGVTSSDVDGSTQVPDSFMTLLLEQGQSYNDSAAFSNEESSIYLGSNLQQVMGDADDPADPNVYDSLTDEEKRLVLPRCLKKGEYTSLPLPYCNGVSGYKVEDAYFWPLSTLEACYVPYPVRVFSYGWWLRSPGEVSPGQVGHNVAYVEKKGAVAVAGVSAEGPFAVRPAFNLDISSVFLTSAAGGTGTKPAGPGLAVVGAAPGGKVKLKFTVKTASQKLTLLATREQSTQSGGTLEFSYRDATTGTDPDQYISCVLEDEEGVQYYGKLKNCAVDNDKSGSLSVPLPAGLDEGKTYTLKIFSEEAGGENSTDFCSEPVPIKLSVSDGKWTVVCFGGTVLEDDDGDDEPVQEPDNNNGNNNDNNNGGAGESGNDSNDDNDNSGGTGSGDGDGHGGSGESGGKPYSPTPDMGGGSCNIMDAGGMAWLSLTLLLARKKSRGN